MKKKSLFILLMTSCLAGVSCSSSLSDFDEWYYLFGTASFNIRLYNAKKENLDYLASYFTNLSSLTDAYTKPSEGVNTLYTINQSNDEVKIDDKLFDILQFSLDMKEATSGYFNPLIGRLTNIWKDAINAETPYIPSKETIDAALAEISESSLTLDKTNKTAKRTGNAIVDLGALAKGYALREATRYLKENGVSEYLINAGTSSLALGKTKENSDWTVSFRDYDGAKFKCSNTCIGTSSISEQGATIEGKNYSHIVNPFTGSAEASYVMCTLKGDDPAIDDVMSTVFMLVGPDGAAEYKKTYGMAYAFYDGKNFTATDDMGVYKV